MKIFDEIKAERKRQTRKWGEQRHPWRVPGSWWYEPRAGRVADAVFAANTGPTVDLQATRAELVQVAAVCVAMIEAIDAEGRKPEGGEGW